MKKKIISVNGGTCVKCDEKNVDIVGMNIHHCKKKDQVYMVCDMPDPKSWWEFWKSDRKTTKVKMNRADAEDFLNKVNANPSNYVFYHIEEL